MHKEPLTVHIIRLMHHGIPPDPNTYCLKGQKICNGYTSGAMCFGRR